MDPKKMPMTQEKRPTTVAEYSIKGHKKSKSNTTMIMGHEKRDFGRAGECHRERE
jgi:hypothetical protein